MQELQLFMKLGTKKLNFLEDETGQMQHGGVMLSFCKYPPPHPHPLTHPITPTPPSVCKTLAKSAPLSLLEIASLQYTKISQLVQMEIRPPKKTDGHFEETFLKGI